MVSFARLLYPLQKLPLLLKHKDIQILNKAITKFLWKKGKPRVALTKLFLPGSEAGTNLPNIRVYNLACLLTTGMYCILQSSRYSNHGLELNMVRPFNLAALLHSSLQKIPRHIKQNLLFRDTIVAWREVRRKLGLSPFVSKFLRIQGNPMFPPRLQYEPFSKWRDKGLTNEANTLKTFKLTAEEFSLPPHHFIYVMQYADFINKTCPKKTTRFQPSFIDKLIADNHNSISDIYCPLNGKFTKPLRNTSMSSWLTDLPGHADLDNILTGYKLTNLIPHMNPGRKPSSK